MKVFVDCKDKRWKKYKIDFEKIVCTAVSGVYSDSEVSIVLVGDDEIQGLNCSYRGIDKPTNVLSFELEDEFLLGDIYISLDTVVKEARAANISVEDHVAHMVVHGVLHLLGYDHLNEKQARVMEGLEIDMLAKLGIKNPYVSDDVSCDDGVCCPGGRFLVWLKKRNVRKNGFWQYVLYALFGVIATLGFAPVYMWWLSLVGLAGAYWLTVRNDDTGGYWRSLLRVFPFGAMYAVGMFWWTLNSIYVVPELMAQFAMWTVPGLVAIALFGGFVFSFPFAVVSCVRPKPSYSAFLFAAMWVLVLWLREWFFTGFPWNPVANIAMPMPVLANSMSLWGALGLTYVLVGLTVGLVDLLRNVAVKRVWCVVGIFVVLLVGGGIYGKYNMSLSDLSDEETPVLIRVVQPATSQAQKATHSREQALQNAEYNLRNLISLATIEGEPDLIVFPETTYPFVVMDNDSMPLGAILGRDVLIGAMTLSDNSLHNSMLVVNEKGGVDKVYSKTHLVPFGEYKPFGFFPAPANLTPGNGAEVITLDLNGRDFVFAPAICYEIIFSDSLLNDRNQRIDAIVNITNDTWFGVTAGVYQHLDMVRRYAIESGVPIVRANYSGISAFVGADGEIIAGLDVGKSGVLDGMVWGAHITPYRQIGLNWWLIIILGFSCFMVFVLKAGDEK